MNYIVIFLIGLLIFLMYILGSYPNNYETFDTNQEQLEKEQADKEKIAFMDSLKEAEQYCANNPTVECQQFTDGLSKLREGINVMLKKYSPTSKAKDFF
jgi:hypothetical protein